MFSSIQECMRIVEMCVFRSLPISPVHAFAQRNDPLAFELGRVRDFNSSTRPKKKVWNGMSVPMKRGKRGKNSMGNESEEGRE
jgi:hypothetical protein